MVRSYHYLRIIEQERLVENARKVGAYFLDQLRDLQTEEPLISAARGRGVFLAFDLPDAKTREEFWQRFFDLGVLTLRSGENSIRFRPALDHHSGGDRRSDGIAAQILSAATQVMKVEGLNLLSVSYENTSGKLGLTDDNAGVFDGEWRGGGPTFDKISAGSTGGDSPASHRCCRRLPRSQFFRFAHVLVK